MCRALEGGMKGWRRPPSCPPLRPFSPPPAPPPRPSSSPASLPPPLPATGPRFGAQSAGRGGSVCELERPEPGRPRPPRLSSRPGPFAERHGLRASPFLGQALLSVLLLKRAAAPGTAPRRDRGFASASRGFGPALRGSGRVLLDLGRGTGRGVGGDESPASGRLRLPGNGGRSTSPPPG